MQQDEKQEGHAPPPTKRGMSVFKKAMMWTAIPVIVFSAIGAPGALAPQTAGTAFGAFVGAAWGLWAVAILVCIGFAIALLLVDEVIKFFLRRRHQAKA